MGDRARKAELFEQLARVGKALGSGKRLELLDLLAQGPRSVAELAAAAGLGMTTASAHLQTLKQSGLVAKVVPANELESREQCRDQQQLAADCVEQTCSMENGNQNWWSD